MKKLFLFGILIVPFIIWSCGESPTKLSSNDFIIKLVDSVTAEPLPDYTIKFFYLFNEQEFSGLINENFHLYPNPITDIADVQILMYQKSKLVIQTDNIISKHNKIIKGPFDADPGNYQFKVNLNDDSLFNHGLFRLYSYVDDVIRDSVNLIRLQLVDLQDFMDNKTLLIENLTTDLNGIVNLKIEFGIWIGEEFYRTINNGQAVGDINVSENIGIKVCNKENEIVKELVIPFDELKKGGTIIEINK